MKTNAGTESAKSTTHTLVLGVKRVTFKITGDRAVVIDAIVYPHPTTGVMKTFCPYTYRMSIAEARKSWARRIALGFKVVA
jgi:hypothetical protein